MLHYGKKIRICRFSWKAFIPYVLKPKKKSSRRYSDSLDSNRLAFISSTRSHRCFSLICLLPICVCDSHLNLMLLFLLYHRSIPLKANPASTGNFHELLASVLALPPISITLSHCRIFFYCFSYSSQLIEYWG